ncbi:MAG: hypothetical protein ACPF9W_06620, partial [Nocardioides sp.]
MRTVLRSAVRLLLVLVVAVVIGLSGISTPATAHEERESVFPAGDGKVPEKRSLKQAADVIVVCKADSKKRIKKIKDKIQIKTSTMTISTRRSVLQFFPRSRLAALVSGCYDSEFLTHDGKPFLDVNFECLRELAAFLTRCKEASEAGRELPPLPTGPPGLKDEMAAMLRD